MCFRQGLTAYSAKSLACPGFFHYMDLEGSRGHPGSFSISLGRKFFSPNHYRTPDALQLVGMISVKKRLQQANAEIAKMVPSR